MRLIACDPNERCQRGCTAAGHRAEEEEEEEEEEECGDARDVPRIDGGVGVSPYVDRWIFHLHPPSTTSSTSSTSSSKKKKKHTDAAVIDGVDIVGPLERDGL